ncbi:recombination protein F [Legionella wadsworthii]|uniref:Recombination protein F n=1 Tax=Legionella wadsworthii TaxID=28088 RepID=A0A378LX76_9GAMM|nr:AAA family ATPase [Legionella wadsworthii]STY30863.1 recombination protein F [Legionella wadsworthii]
MPIRTLSIQGYRSIQNIRLPMDDINVIVGANGCGKSNLYQAVRLLANAVNGELAETLAYEGGMPSILWAGKRKQLTRSKAPVRMILTIETDDFNYELTCGLPMPSLSMFALDPEVKSEQVWVGKSRRPGTTLMERQGPSAWIMNQDGQRTPYPVSLSQSESILSQIQDPHLYPELFSLSKQLKRWRFYHHFRTDSGSPIRNPQIGTRTEVLSNDGYNLAAALQTIMEIGDHEMLAQSIGRAFPGSKLIINVDSKTRFDIQLQMPGILRPLEARELSDGTLRYLCLIAALLSPRPATLLALNEPETSLHPELMEPMAELIAKASQYSQIWLTTHSYDLAMKIEKLSGKKPIHLIRTESGTQISGLE